MSESVSSSHLVRCLRGVAVSPPVLTTAIGYRLYLVKRSFAVAFNRLNRLAGHGLTLKKSVTGRVLPFRVQDYNLCFFYLDIPTEPENEALLSALGEELCGDFIDVGANYGQLAFDLLGKFKRMVLIDPNSEATSFLHALFAEEPSVFIVEAGAGDAVQSGTFCLADEQQSGGSTITTDLDCVGPKISITTIDEVVSQTGIKPSVIKIDVEGFEERVLLGASSTIAEHKPVLAWEVRDSERFEACRGLVPDWHFYRIDSRLVHGSSGFGKARAIARALVFGSEVRVSEVCELNGFISLIFAVHPEQQSAFLRALRRLESNGVEY